MWRTVTSFRSPLRSYLSVSEIKVTATEIEGGETVLSSFVSWIDDSTYRTSWERSTGRRNSPAEYHALQKSKIGFVSKSAELLGA